MSSTEEMGTAWNDADARARIRDEHGCSMLVEAAAGTGKTTALVDRLVSMLRSGVCELERVVVTTFTDKAAGRLTLKLREGLERVCADARNDRERRACERALRDLETARVGTIHGLCADLLRERPVEAGVDPAFTVLDDGEAHALIDRAIEEELALASTQPGEGLRRFLRRRLRTGETPATRLRQAVRHAVDHRDQLSPWRRDPFAREARIDEVLADMRALAEIAARASRPDDGIARSVGEIARFVGDLDRRERASPRDYDGIEADLAELVAPWVKWWGWNGGGDLFAPGISRQEVIARRDALRARIETLVDEANRDLAACLRSELEPILVRYEALKQRYGALDFLDLLLRTRAMLVEHATVRRELQERFTHIFVDEFQDTDPIQADIVLLLAADDPRVTQPAGVRPAPGKLFLVGDPKQSIYRFRRANLGAYLRVRAQLEAAGVRILQLTTSFRSLPAIQGVVNAAFSAAMETAEPGTQAAYVPLTRHRAPESRRPSVVALPVPRPYAQTGFAKEAVDTSTPPVVGAFVDWLVHESGWTVIDPDTRQETRVAPRHVCLLFRHRHTGGTDVVQPYVRELEARAIPHTWVGGASFHDRDEIVAIRALAAAIEYPDDALSVYAALRGPFLALTDAELLLFRDRVGPLHPLRRVSHQGTAWLDPALRPVFEALEILRDLHLRRNRRPIADTFAEFFERTRAYAVLALWRGGDQRLASVLRVLDLARRFDQRGALSFRGFVEMLERQAEHSDGGGGEVVSVEEGQEGVRVMTVHGAKGLEFPVVVLCDPTAPLGDSVDCFTDAVRKEAFFRIAHFEPIELRERAAAISAVNRAEAVRLAYVAATRARDLLVVPAAADRPFEGGWLSVLNPGIYPPQDVRRAGPRPAPGCPAFGVDATLERAGGVDAPQDAIRPGRYAWGNPEIEVLWWDPRALRLEVEAREGVRCEEVLTKREGVDDGGRAHTEWRDRRARAIEQGSLPSVPARTIAEAARRPRAIGRSPQIERVPRAPGAGARPTGRRIESLFRGALPLVRAGDGEPEITAWVRARARALGADAEEEAAVREALTALSRHPWFLDARQRAFPIAAPAGEAVLEGTVDLLREQDGELVVVRVLLRDGEPSEADRAEAAIAAELVADAMDRPARPALLLS
jgi:ATP-dependent exoDNAse (exonuclease V) beta subunit